MKQLHFFQLILISFLFFSCVDFKQKKPLEIEGSPTPIALPNENPDKWLLAHIDVETTGLIPGYHEMIDAGIVMTDLIGNVIDSLFIRMQPDHPGRLSPGAYAVNAYDPKKWEAWGALSNPEAVDSIIAFHKRVAGDKNVLFVAHNSQFDAAFMDHLFRGAKRSWRELYYYYVLDIPSMAWGLGFRDLTGTVIREKYHIADEPHVADLHTGITGAMKNVRVYQALIAVNPHCALTRSNTLYLLSF